MCLYRVIQNLPTANGCNILVDQNCKRVDLTSPLQAIINAHRIFKRQELLANILKGKSAGLSLDSSSVQNWMMSPKVRQ